MKLDLNVSTPQGWSVLLQITRVFIFSLKVDYKRVITSVLLCIS